MHHEAPPYERRLTCRCQVCMRWDVRNSGELKGVMDGRDKDVSTGKPKEVELTVRGNVKVKIVAPFLSGLFSIPFLSYPGLLLLSSSPLCSPLLSFSFIYFPSHFSLDSFLLPHAFALESAISHSVPLPTVQEILFLQEQDNVGYDQRAQEDLREGKNSLPSSPLSSRCSGWGWQRKSHSEMSIFLRSLQSGGSKSKRKLVAELHEKMQKFL